MMYWFGTLVYLMVGAISLVVHEGCDSMAMTIYERAPSERAANVWFAVMLLSWPFWLLFYGFLLPVGVYKIIRYTLGGIKDWF